MKKAAKIWLITAGALVVTGLLMCVGAAAAVGFDITKLSTVQYTTFTENISGDFQRISIETTTADVELVITDGATCRAELFEAVNAFHTVKVEGDTLTVRSETYRKWTDYINLDFNKPKVTLYLPKTSYTALSAESATGDIHIPGGFTFESVSVKSHTGDICLSDLSAGTARLKATTGNVTLSGVKVTEDLAVETSTGDIRFSDVTCGSCRCDASTGDITLRDTLAGKELRLKCSTGDIRFDRSDAEAIYAATSTGDVTGTLRSEKIVFASSDTGEIRVPQCTTGGRCEIHTSTGDIHIGIAS